MSENDLQSTGAENFLSVPEEHNKSHQVLRYLVFYLQRTNKSFAGLGDGERG